MIRVVVKEIKKYNGIQQKYKYVQMKVVELGNSLLELSAGIVVNEGIKFLQRSFKGKIILV